MNDLERTRAKYARIAYDHRFMDACREARKANPSQPLTEDQVAAIKLQISQPYQRRTD